MPSITEQQVCPYSIALLADESLNRLCSNTKSTINDKTLPVPRYTDHISNSILSRSEENGVANEGIVLRRRRMRRRRRRKRRKRRMRRRTRRRTRRLKRRRRRFSASGDFLVWYFSQCFFVPLDVLFIKKHLKMNSTLL